MPDWAAAAICLLLTLMTPFAIAGMALINAGLNRSRSATHTLLSCLCAVAVAVLAYGAIGTSIQGSAGHPGHIVLIAAKPWDLIGAGRLFAHSVSFDNLNDGSLILLYQLFAVGLASLIPIAGGAERWRLTAIFASTALIAGLTYPLFSHWVWGGGWLAQLGTNYGLGRGIIDTGGAAVVQVSGGLTALVIAWFLGPRQGKFTSDGIPTAMPGHNGVIVLFGCFLALIGWTAFTSAGSLLFYRMNAGVVVLVAINMLLAGAGGALAALITTRVRFGKPDASLTANGWIGSLVAVSAGAPFYNASEAILIGIAAGVLIVLAIDVIEVRMHVDDPAGAISVHAVGGIWGLLAVGMFAAGTTSGQFLAQLIGVGTLLGFVLPLSFALNALLNRLMKYRVESGGERQGMDLFELGAGAYPEFVTHRDDRH